MIVRRQKRGLLISLTLANLQYLYSNESFVLRIYYLMGVIDTVKWYFGVMTLKRFGNTDVDGKGHLPLANSRWIHGRKKTKVPSYRVVG